MAPIASPQSSRGTEAADLDDWVSIEPLSISPPAEPIIDRIVRIQADLKELLAYYKFETSPTRYDRLRRFYEDELASLSRAPFEKYTQDDKVDFLLLKNYLSRALRALELEKDRDDEFAPLFEPFATEIRSWMEARMRVAQIEPKEVAASFHGLVDKVSVCKKIAETSKPGDYSKAAGYRAAKSINQLREHLQETYDFYAGYEPLWDWWVREPHANLDTALVSLAAFVKEKVAGIEPGHEDSIVGEPIGREGLLAELKAEMIPYKPEALIRLAEKEYSWCEAEMIKASEELGFGEEWRNALEHVKGLVEPPGAQPVFIKSLVDEGTAYVKKHDLVTVPRVAEEAIRMIMIEPSRQKVSPFFLGGPVLMVSYPTSEMAHADKMMSMRGNNRHFSKATAFHEMIPGHHLQLFVAERAKPHRQVFETPFYIEGWALYWELVFWSRGDFFTSPEDRVGTLFWRMHRCARIVFSLKFHLGQMSPADCVDLLVNWVGHERANAEGEVRRSFNGDYSPLYQAAYLLGALQLWKLRSETLGDGLMDEKHFHDKILAANMMPIELLRGLILNQKLDRNFESKWKFYGDI
ncbi:putative X-Pro dipeptidyl-peptidase [Seiridium unicorne]|uniref:X-Pro dipeptidyl-peptidase n=1 Tax=Seiridium unicorne TaxID=138068 RepID=A0ABR2VGF8_9PEZI